MTPLTVKIALGWILPKIPKPRARDKKNHEPTTSHIGTKRPRKKGTLKPTRIVGLSTRHAPNIADIVTSGPSTGVLLLGLTSTQRVAETTAPNKRKIRYRVCPTELSRTFPN